MKVKKIACIVDDDEIFQFTVAKSIELTGHEHEIITFNDGDKAFEYVQEFSSNSDKLPDVIFLDINMPVMNGWEFMEEFEKIAHKLTKSIKVYIITSSIDQADSERASKHRLVAEFISKPLAIEKYKELLKTDN